MEYVRSLAECFFWYLPFAFLLSILCSIIQLPFAIIHKNAARAVIVVYSYYICMFFSSHTLAATEQSNLSPVPFFIVYSLVILFSHISMITPRRNSPNHNSEDQTLFLVLAIASIPAYLLMFHFGFYFFPQPLQWYFSLIEFLLSVPLLGGIISFLFHYLSGIFLLGILLYMVIFLFFTIYSLIIERQNHSH